MYKEGK